MNSSTTPSFRESLRALPPRIRSLAREKYELWLADPHHPSLRFKKVGDYWSIRVGLGCRALGRIKGDTLYWFWIGFHDEYLRLIHSR